MKICLVHQYYKTPKTGGAIRTYYIAKFLKAEGHDITVITAGNKRTRYIDESEGYPVHYLPVYYENHLSFGRRIHAFFLFVRGANQLIKTLAPPDLNYVVTTPLTTGLIAMKAKNRFGTPYIFEVGDLWPDAPVALGVLKNYWLKKLAYRWERRFYQNARAIIALSPDIEKTIAEKSPGSYVQTITNFADKELFEAGRRTESTSFKKQWGLQGKLVVAYTGAVGIANHLEYLIEAAEAARSYAVAFIIVGDGARLEDIKTKVFLKGLSNIIFFSYRSKYKLQEIVSAADAFFISFKNVPLLSAGSPNKFFDGLAAGKLIILNFEGWLKALVEKHRCGFYYPPGRPDKFVEKLMPYLRNPDLLASAGACALELADKFTPSSQLKHLSEIINDCFLQTFEDRPSG